MVVVKWPYAANRLILLLICNLLVWLISIKLVDIEKSPDYDNKMAAAAKALTAQQIIGPRLLGEEYTLITTTLGPYKAKILSQHPDFAAVAVDMLTTAGIKAGDRVAVNLSGSFPALNIAVIAAVDAIGARPVITSSVGSSTWGANRPDYTWLDMEKIIFEKKIWPWRSSAVSLGGEGDNGGGIFPEGKQLAEQALGRSGVPRLESQNLNDAIERRIEIYRENTGALPKALINVGGNHVVFGQMGHAAPLRQGLTNNYRPSLSTVDGLAEKFIQSGRPVIHFINIARLAAQYGIKDGSSPGQSSVYYTRTLPPYLRAALIGWLLAVIAYLQRGRMEGWWKNAHTVKR